MYNLNDQVKVNEMGKVCSMNRGEEKYMVGKPEGKRPLGRPRRRWMKNNKGDLRETGWYGLD
jgi:hypothetical protein